MSESVLVYDVVDGRDRPLELLGDDLNRHLDSAHGRQLPELGVSPDVVMLLGPGPRAVDRLLVSDLGGAVLAVLALGLPVALVGDSVFRCLLEVTTGQARLSKQRALADGIRTVSHNFSKMVLSGKLRTLVGFSARGHFWGRFGNASRFSALEPASGSIVTSAPPL